MAPKILYKKESKRGKRKNFEEDAPGENMMNAIKNHMPGGWTIGGNLNGSNDSNKIKRSSMLLD